MSVLRKHPDASFLFTGSAFIEDDGMTIAHVLHVPGKSKQEKTSEAKRDFLFIRVDPKRTDAGISDAGRRRNSRGFCYMAGHPFQNSMQHMG